MVGVLAVWGLWLIVVTLFLQWTVASVAKAKLPRAIPGKFDSKLGPEHFAFRAHRTYENSRENFPLFFGALLVAYYAEVDAGLVAACVWVFALARLAYTGWYYAVATEKNPSFRSLLFAVSLLASLALLFGSLFFIQ